MTSQSKQRLILYPVVLVILGGLAYGGFVYEAEPDVGTLVNSAEVLAQCGMFDEAIENAERALKQDPDHRYAHIILGYAYGQQEEFDRALSHYERALAVTPQDEKDRPLLRLYHAELLCRAGRAEQGEREAREVVAEHPDELQAHYVVAQALRAQNRLDEAAGEYLAVEKAAPEDPQPLVLRAEVEREQEDLEGALKLLTRAVEMAPDNVEFRLGKADVHEALGQREEAVAELVTVAGTKKVAVRRWLDSDPARAALRADDRVSAAIALPEPGEKP